MSFGRKAIRSADCLLPNPASKQGELDDLDFFSPRGSKDASTLSPKAKEHFHVKKDGRNRLQVPAWLTGLTGTWYMHGVPCLVSFCFSFSLFPLTFSRCVAGLLCGDEHGSSVTNEVDRVFCCLFFVDLLILGFSCAC